MSKKVKSDVETVARIRVVGVGGSGNNAVNHMVQSQVRGVDFIAINTDAQDLIKSKAKDKIHIGTNLTRGLGTGMNPDLGKQSAEENKDEIQEALSGSDMVFVTCGMGGGTGTGAAPIVAQAARDLGALTIGVVTKPFSFEGAQRMRLAEQGLAELKKAVDALIVIPNDKILQIVNRDTGIKNAFAMCDDVLKQAVEGISDIITTTGIINVDFADVRAVMANAGSALIGIGTATGEKRAEEAARAAISSPLLDVSIHGAKGVLFSVTGGDDLGMLEVQDAAKIITEAVDPDAKVIFGAVTDDAMKKGEFRITVIATGFPEGSASRGSMGAAPMSAPTTPIYTAPKRRTTFGRMEEELPKIKSEEPRPVIEDRPVMAAQPIPKPPSTPVIPTPPAPVEEDKSTDDDDWSSFPSFLRRSK
jgi:cell division protein FtsZ